MVFRSVSLVFICPFSLFVCVCVYMSIYFYFSAFLPFLSLLSTRSIPPLSLHCISLSLARHTNTKIVCTIFSGKVYLSFRYSHLHATPLTITTFVICTHPTFSLLRSIRSCVRLLARFLFTSHFVPENRQHQQKSNSKCKQIIYLWHANDPLQTPVEFSQLI